MTKPLSEICQEWHDEQGAGFCSRAITDSTDGCPASEEFVTGCRRPNDDKCVALDEWLDRQVDDCCGCDHLDHEDPSPPGVSLPAGSYAVCLVDAEPGSCPQKEWEDDMPTEAGRG